MRRRKDSKAFEIALSAISTSFAVTGLLLGFFVPYVLATGYMIAVIAMMVPLSKQFFWGGFLAYAGTCILTFILGAVAKFWDLVPFIAFFGLHPLVNALQMRFKINRWVAFVVKAVWFIGTLFAGYFMMVYGVVGAAILDTQLYQSLKNYVYIIIPVVGALFFLIYDYLVFKCQIMINSLIYRIKK